MKCLTGKIYKKQTTVAKNPQIFDLLQLSRTEKELRDFCRLILRQRGKWKKTMPDTIHSGCGPKLRIRGTVLCKQAKQAVRLYKLVRLDRIHLFRLYIDGLPQMQGFKRLAS